MIYFVRKIGIYIFKTNNSLIVETLSLVFSLQAFYQARRGEITQACCQAN